MKNKPSEWKKSIKEAISEALTMSQQHADIAFYVLDKPGHRALCLSMDWSIKDRIKNGWSITHKAVNGLLVDIGND